MKTLKFEKIDHIEEMQKILNLQNKKISNFPYLKKKLEKLNLIRKNLQNPIQIKNQENFHENNIEEYTEILQNFKLYINLQKKNIYNFKWQSNINKKFIEKNDLDFEIGCMYYNYSVFYFNKGISLFCEKKNNKKNLLKNFLKSQNGFLECKKCFLRLEKNNFFFEEVKIENLEIYLKIVDCFILKSVYFFLEENFNKISLNEILNIHFQIFQNFEKNIFFFKKLNGDQFINSIAFLENLESLFYYHLNWFLILKVFILDLKKKENSLENDNAKKIGFLVFLNFNFDFLKKYEKNLSNEDFYFNLKDKIKDVLKNLVNLKKENENLNNNTNKIIEINFENLKKFSEEEFLINFEDYIKEKIEIKIEVNKKLLNEIKFFSENFIIKKNEFLKENRISKKIDIFKKERFKIYKKEKINVFLKILIIGIEKIKSKIKDMKNGDLLESKKKLKVLKKKSQKNKKYLLNLKKEIISEKSKKKKIEEKLKKIIFDYEKICENFQNINNKDYFYFEIILKFSNLFQNSKDNRIENFLSRLEIEFENNKNLIYLINLHYELNNLNSKISENENFQKNIFDFFFEQQKIGNLELDFCEENNLFLAFKTKFENFDLKQIISKINSNFQFISDFEIISQIDFFYDLSFNIDKNIESHNLIFDKMEEIKFMIDDYKKFLEIKKHQESFIITDFSGKNVLYL